MYIECSPLTKRQTIQYKNGLVMLSICSRVYWPFQYLLWRNYLIQSSTHLKLDYLTFYWVIRILYIFWILDCYQIHGLQTYISFYITYEKRVLAGMCQTQTSLQARMHISKSNLASAYPEPWSFKATWWTRKALSMELKVFSILHKLFTILLNCKVCRGKRKMILNLAINKLGHKRSL